MCSFVSALSGFCDCNRSSVYIVD